MKITNTQLKRIIKEELENVMNETEMGGVHNVNTMTATQPSPSANATDEVGDLDAAMATIYDMISTDPDNYLQTSDLIGSKPIVSAEQLQALQAQGKISIDHEDFEVDRNQITIINNTQY
tara:strand:- start:30 stop:389 length:360 start_codon:yes stop_codon:yes gene_type:complete